MHVLDLTFFGKRYKNVARASQLLLLYLMICDEKNDISATKTQLIEIYDKVFGVALPRRTLSDWIKILAENGAIKYKYSGSARLNPFFYYHGDADNYDDVVNDYNEFVSAIPMTEFDQDDKSA